MNKTTVMLLAVLTACSLFGGCTTVDPQRDAGRRYEDEAGIYCNVDLQNIYFAAVEYTAVHGELPRGFGPEFLKALVGESAVLSDSIRARVLSGRFVGCDTRSRDVSLFESDLIIASCNPAQIAGHPLSTHLVLADGTVHEIAGAWYPQCPLPRKVVAAYGGTRDLLSGDRALWSRLARILVVFYTRLIGMRKDYAHGCRRRVMTL